MVENHSILLFIIAASLIAIVIQVYQSIQVKIHSDISVVVKSVLYSLGVFLTIFSLFYFDYYFEQLMFVLLSIVLGLTPHIDGLTNKGARVNRRGNISTLYRYEKSSDWRIFRQKKKLKCRFIYKKNSNSLGEVIYITFDKKEEARIIDFLENRNFSIQVEEQY